VPAALSDVLQDPTTLIPVGILRKDGWTDTDLQHLLDAFPAASAHQCAGVLTEASGFPGRWPALDPRQTRSWLRVWLTIRGDLSPAGRFWLTITGPASGRSPDSEYLAVTNGDHDLARLALAAHLTPTELAGHLAAGTLDLAGLRALAALNT